MHLFLFGTLMDADLLAAVLGRPASPCRPAAARGFRRVLVAGRCYPMLVADAAGQVDGLLANDLDEAALARLIAYEGEEYALGPIRVRTADGGMAEAGAFFCHPWVQATRKPFDLAAWRRRHKRSAVAALRRQGQPIAANRIWR